MKGDDLDVGVVIRLVREVADRLFGEIEKGALYQRGRETITIGAANKVIGIAAMRDALTKEFQDCGR